MENMTHTVRLTFDTQGPDRVTLGELIKALDSLTYRGLGIDYRLRDGTVSIQAAGGQGRWVIEVEKGD